jgi:hypothetical protein
MLIGVPMRPPVAAIAVCAALAGCSLGDDEEPKPVAGSANEIAAAIDRLERATRAEDWATVCDELFSAAALERAGGRDCERLLRETAGEARRPDIRLVSIDLAEDRARARVRSRSAGQAPVEETVVLVRERGEWRIESLAAG